jgi:hypothetical protein
MSKDSEYKRNSKIVKEIYNIDPSDKSVNIHHIVKRSDVKRRPRFWEGFNVNQLSNLIPLDIRIHDRTHELINQVEPPDQPKHRRKHRH